VKPLVCVAADGTLELWEFKDHNWNIVDESICELKTTYYFAKAMILFFSYYEHTRSPEFWGREILGEL
jgi:hypothetical protein